MTLDIGDLLMEGFERTVARNGLLFAAVFVVLSAISAVLAADAMQQPAAHGVPMTPAPSLGLPAGIAAVLSLALLLVSVLVTVGAIRTFVNDETETVRSEHFTRNVLWVGGNLIVGGLVFGVVVGLGFAFLIVPGLFLLVSLFFWSYYVVVDDENFVAGFRRSWAATAGHRLQLFALGVIVAIVGLVVNAVFSIPAFVLPRGAGLFVSQVGSALTQVFFLATASRTFVRLTAPDRDGVPAGAHRDHAVE